MRKVIELCSNGLPCRSRIRKLISPLDRAGSFPDLLKGLLPRGRHPSRPEHVGVGSAVLDQLHGHVVEKTCLCLITRQLASPHPLFAPYRKPSRASAPPTTPPHDRRPGEERAPRLGDRPGGRVHRQRSAREASGLQPVYPAGVCGPEHVGNANRVSRAHSPASSRSAYHPGQAAPVVERTQIAGFGHALAPGAEELLVEGRQLQQLAQHRRGPRLWSATT